MTELVNENGRRFGPFLPALWSGIRGFASGSLLSLALGIVLAAGMLAMALLIRALLEAAGWVLRLVTR
jgi:hypothetical protein